MLRPRFRQPCRYLRFPLPLSVVVTIRRARPMLIRVPIDVALEGRYSLGKATVREAAAGKLAGSALTLGGGRRKLWRGASVSGIHHTFLCKSFELLGRLWF